MDPITRRELMLEHYQNPVHKGLLNDKEYIKVNTHNESCIDNLEIAVKIEDGIIKDIRFDGEACAISTSATSIMIETLLGKSIDKVKEIVQNYENMINEENYDEEILGQLNVYNETYLQPNRKKCALLPFDALKQILKQIEKEK